MIAIKKKNEFSVLKLYRCRLNATLWMKNTHSSYRTGKKGSGRIIVDVVSEQHKCNMKESKTTYSLILDSPHVDIVHTTHSINVPDFESVVWIVDQK